MLFYAKKNDKFECPKLKKYLETLRDGKYTVEIKRYTSKRTSQQNRALHLYFRLLAEALNDAGFDMKKTIKKDLDIPWTETTIKEYLWRPVQLTYLRKESTTKLNSNEVDKVYDIINREIGQRTGVTIPWPCIETLIENEKSY